MPVRLTVATLLVAGAVLTAACAPSIPAETVSIAGVWKFRVGDDTAWASPDLDDRAWLSIEVPTGWGPVDYQGAGDPRGWYRRTIVVPLERRDRLGIAMGPVDSAYELYANGRLVGSVGRLPPNPVEDYDRRIVVPIASGVVGADGRLVLAVRAWTNRLRSAVAITIAPTRSRTASPAAPSWSVPNRWRRSSARSASATANSRITRRR